MATLRNCLSRAQHHRRHNSNRHSSNNRFHTLNKYRHINSIRRPQRQLISSSSCLQHTCPTRCHTRAKAILWEDCPFPHSKGATTILTISTLVVWAMGTCLTSSSTSRCEQVEKVAHMRKQKFSSRELFRCLWPIEGHTATRWQESIRLKYGQR